MTAGSSPTIPASTVDSTCLITFVLAGVAVVRPSSLLACKEHVAHSLATTLLSVARPDRTNIVSDLDCSTTMRDPFPFPAPEWLQALVKPTADRLSLTTLPLLFHEVLFSIGLYTFIYYSVSPRLSAWLFPKTYPKLDRRTTINWDVHVVSMFQSLFICGLALFIIFFDTERADMDWQGRIWGYTGIGGFLQAMAEGYFIWDLIVTAWHLEIFGWGMLAHAVAATIVFSLGFRPFVVYYGPVFILYELSSPFNNIHWHLDKLHLTGSVYQWVNGIALIITFFSCRLVWGSINSYYVTMDAWKAIQHSRLRGDGDAGLKLGHGQSAEAAGGDIPLWLPLAYMISNIILNFLNCYWFRAMIQTIRRRFPPPFGTMKTASKADEKKSGVEEKSGVEIQRGLLDNGRRTVEVDGREVRSRRRG